MSFDYSVKGKGNQRKTFRVINEYTYDKKGNIVRHPWDSDVEYLYETTVKFRGTIDPTREAPHHLTVKPGDMYISNGSGTIIDDSDWRNLQGNSVKLGEAILFTDSEIWTTLGTSNVGDSEDITNVDTIYNYKVRMHRSLHKLHYAAVSDTLFFETDSDVMYVFEGEALYPGQPTLFEAHKDSTSVRTAKLVFNNSGVLTDGNIRVVGIDRQQKNIASSVGLIGDSVTNGIISFSGIQDSENQTIEILLDSDLEFSYGDEIIFTPNDSHNRSIVKSFDGKGFKRVAKIKMDLDSETHDRQAADSDILIIIKDNDSEIRRMLDSEIHDRKSVDSDLQVQITDNDSDILWLYNRDSDFTSNVDSDILALQSEDSDQWIVIADNDSEIRRMLDSEIHDRKSIDSDLWHKLSEVDSDLAILFGRTDSDDLTLQDLRTHAEQMIDSERHDWKASDSDLTKDLDSDIHDLKAKDSDQDIIISDNDSEINRRLDSEIHDRISVDSDHDVRITDNDSDIHALYAFDSDLTKDLDSDLHDLRAKDSDLQVQITDNDSDIAYLYNVTVKFRGTVDPTTDAPLHTEVKPGDMYVSHGSGSFTSDWDGVDGLSVNVGDTLLYTDSERWISLGVAEIGDSESIHQIPSLSWFNSQPHTTRNKLYWGSHSRNAFFEIDSDVVVRVPTDFPLFPSLIEGSTNEANNQHVDLSFTNVGPNTSGTLRYNAADDTDVAMSIVAGATGTAVDSELVNFIVDDSEHMTATIGVNRVPAKGDYIEYRDHATKEASRVQFDGVRGWLKWDHSKWVKQDLDSDAFWLEKEIASSIGGFRVGTIQAFATTDMPVGFRIADGSQYNTLAHPELFRILGTDRLPDLRGAVLRGFSTDYIKDKNGPTQPGDEGFINLGSQNYTRRFFQNADASTRVSATQAVVTYNGRGGIGSDDSDVVWDVTATGGEFNSTFQLPNLFNENVNGYLPPEAETVANITITPRDPNTFLSSFRIMPGRSNDHGYRNIEAIWTFEDGHSYVKTSHQTMSSGGNEAYVNFENDYIESPLASIKILAFSEWASTAGLRSFQPSFWEAIDSDLINPTGGRSHTVAYGIAMYDGAAVVYDSDLIKSVFNEYIIRVDSEIARIDSDWKRNTDSDRHNYKAADSDLRVRVTDNDSDILWLYNRDSDFTSNIDSDIHDLRAKDSDQDIIIADNDSEIHRQLDSEIHDRKSVDSDLWHKLSEVDSDLAILFGRTDSDDLTLQDLRTHAEQMIDSERHDWNAADSDLTKDIDSDLHDLKAKDSDQDIVINDNDSEIRRMLDSEIHDRKAADSDLLYLVGRTFVGTTIDPNVKPPLRRGDVWIDTSNQKMYYYDEDTEAWVQVISTTSP